MRQTRKRRDYFVSTASDNYHSDDDSDTIIMWCQRCLELGFNNPLKERLYRKDQLVNNEKPTDWEMWRQCHVCGEIVAVVHAKQENELTGIKDVPDSIHDTKKLTVEHFVPSRRTRRNAIKRIDRTLLEDNDLDVKPKTDRGSKLVSYETSDR